MSANFPFGAQAATFLHDTNPKGGKVAQIEGAAGSPNARARIKGFKEQLATYPELQLVASQPGNLLLLWRELLAHLKATWARLGPCRGQLSPGAVGERLHPDLGEQFLGHLQPITRLGEAPLAAQPLSEEQMRTGELGADSGSIQLRDRLPVGRFGRIALGEKRPTARLDAECKTGTRRLGGRH